MIRSRRRRKSSPTKRNTRSIRTRNTRRTRKSGRRRKRKGGRKKKHYVRDHPGQGHSMRLKCRATQKRLLAPNNGDAAGAGVDKETEAAVGAEVGTGKETVVQVAVPGLAAAVEVQNGTTVEKQNRCIESQMNSPSGGDGTSPPVDAQMRESERNSNAQ